MAKPTQRVLVWPVGRHYSRLREGNDVTFRDSMSREPLRRFVPWVLTAAILAVGITAAVEVGTSGGNTSAVSNVGPSTSISAGASPQSRSAAAKLAPNGASSASPQASAASTATAASLPNLSQTHPGYPPTQTLVDRKDGLVVAVYTVQHGDYLSEIAARFGTALTDVYVWSKNTVGPNANLIYAGQQIVVKVLAKI